MSTKLGRPCGINDGKVLAALSGAHRRLILGLRREVAAEVFVELGEALTLPVVRQECRGEGEKPYRRR